MTAITNYNTLVQAIKDVSEDDGTEFAEYIPTAIDLAEEKLFKDLELTDLEQIVTDTMTISDNTIDKPSGYVFAHYFLIRGVSFLSFLTMKREDFVREYWPNSATTGQPKYYADKSSTTFLVAPTPDAGYTYELKYTAKPDKLSTSTQSNYYTDNCNDLLFFASMLEMCKFMKAWDQIQIWESSYQSAKDAWNSQDRRKVRDDITIPQSPSSGPNNIRTTESSGA